MSPPVHGVYARGYQPGNHVRPLYVGKFIEGGSPAPESGRLTHEFVAWALCCRWLPWRRCPIARRVGLRRAPEGINIRRDVAAATGSRRSMSWGRRSSRRFPRPPVASCARLSDTFALLLEYDGAAFRGWQDQPGMATVQGTLESAVQALLGKRLAVHGASRTDAGVHALGQVASLSGGRSAPCGAGVVALGGPAEAAVEGSERTGPWAHAAGSPLPAGARSLPFASV